MTLRGRFIPERALALFLDVDGTLLELAASPEAVRVPAALRNTLELASQREARALALVSGRSLEDLDRLFAPSRFAACAQHGFERRNAQGDVTRARVDHRLLEPVGDQLRARLDRHGSLVLEGRQAAQQPPMADAIQAYRMFTPGRAAHLDFVSQRYGDLREWMSKHFAQAPRPPDLAAAGFKPVGARLVPTADGPAALVLYLNARGEAIAFYVRPPSLRGILPPGRRRDGDLITEYGSANGFDFAFVSRTDPRLLHVVHRAVRSLT